jgi:hypothetical protein
MPNSRRPLFAVLVALASLLAASLLACGRQLVALSTAMPMIMCTAPACGPNESYYCPDRCPGGCGTTCATHTPGPTSSSQCPPGELYLPEGDAFKCMTPTPYVTNTPKPCATGEVYQREGQVLKCMTPTPIIEAGPPCLITIRPPPPDAPTASAGGTPMPSRKIDPHVEVCATATTLRVGEVVTLVGQAVDVGLPYFDVNVKEAGAADFGTLVSVTYGNEVKNHPEASQVMEVVSARGDQSHVIVTLRAGAAGAVELVINATGEVHYGYPGPATWAGGGSETLTLEVRQ